MRRIAPASERGWSCRVRACWQINSPKDPTDTVKCLTLSPDGSAFAAASFDGSVRIYSSPGRADSRV